MISSTCEIINVERASLFSASPCVQPPGLVVFTRDHAKQSGRGEVQFKPRRRPAEVDDVVYFVQM